MSLDFDFAEMKNRVGQDWYDAITTSPETRHLIGADDTHGMKWHPVTNRLIWACMAVDMNGLTEESLDEFWFRLRLIQKLDAPDLEYGDGREVNLTKQDLQNHIGLRTNVSTLSRSKWVSKIMKYEEKMLNDWPNGQGKTAFEMVNEIQAS